MHDSVGSNSTQAFFNFIKSLVGIAILDLPYAANKAGYALACICFILISYGTIRTTTFLIEIADSTQIHTYSQIVKQQQGNWASSLLDFALVGQQLFACIAYIIFFQYTSERALTHLDILLHPALNLALSVALILPLSMIRDMHFFHSTSTIGFLLALFALISVSHVALGNSELQEVRAFKWEGVFNFVGVAMFAYEGICTALPVRYSMSEKFRFNKVFLISSITGLLMYQTFIVINCNAYGDSLKQIIFFNLPETKLTFVLSFLYAISILLTYPVQIHPAFDVLQKRAGCDENKYRWIWLRLLVTILLYCIAYIVPNLSMFLNLVGVVFGTILQFWFPITLRLQTMDLSLVEKVESYGLLSFGVMTGVLGFYFTMLDIYLQYSHA